jgi:hypothetical protein
MEPEFNGSVSKKMSMRAEMPIMKVYGKSQLNVIVALVEQPRIVANLRGSGYIVSPG